MEAQILSLNKQMFEVSSDIQQKYMPFGNGKS